MILSCRPTRQRKINVHKAEHKLQAVRGRKFNIFSSVSISRSNDLGALFGILLETRLRPHQAEQVTRVLAASYLEGKLRRKRSPKAAVTRHRYSAPLFQDRRLSKSGAEKRPCHRAWPRKDQKLHLAACQKRPQEHYAGVGLNRTSSAL